MQIVNTGHMYQIYDDGVQTYDKLPAQIYTVNFSKMTGFYLQKFDDIVITEKVYGVAPEKLEKVIKAFDYFERNLGIILSGEKGIGKSLFAKMLSARMADKGYPVIIVNSFIPGIADFITSIQQEVVVLFDEFDKTFYAKDGDSMTDPQSSMLTLFDGLSQGKKMFIVTCNNIRHLNDYIVNRPGRFHYHFRFDFPNNAEIEEYLKDKMSEEFYDEIPKVVGFAAKVPLNYDCLRAIGFELSCGIPFEQAIRDLNILNVQQESYIATVAFKDGAKVHREICFDMFGEEAVTRNFAIGEYSFDIEFDPTDIKYTYDRGGNSVNGENLDIRWRDWYVDDEDKPAYEEFKKGKEVDYLLLRRKIDKSLHYAV